MIVQAQENSPMVKPADHYFVELEEPAKSCLQFLRMHILTQSRHVTEAWKYGMPFYCFKGKMFCYLWVHKKLQLPYIGFTQGKLIHHPDLLQEKRAKMKILLLNPNEDLPMDKINLLLQMSQALYD